MTSYLTFNKAHESTAFTPTEEEKPEQLLAREFPLNNEWSIWEQQGGQNGAGYSDATKKICSCSTLQDFWKKWNHVPQPSELLESKRIVRTEDGNDICVDSVMLFKDSVKPAWEDPANAAGGHFLLSLKSSVGGPQIDEYWNNLVLACVGNTIKPRAAEKITGIRLVDKLQGGRPSGMIRLEIWFKEVSDQEGVDLLKHQLEQVLRTRMDNSLSPVIKLDLKAH